METLTMKLLSFSVLLVLICISGNKVGQSAKELDWWHKTIVYQVYPRSFMDSDGDGIGDLRGIKEKADYFKELGVGAIWLSPIFDSPMKDFGYDISNYTKIWPKFGTLDDLKDLKNTLNDYGIKLILDFVPNHSSDQCEWFQKSIKKIDPYTDYYVWKDPKGYDEDGKPIPPNNWISIFNFNPAWTFNKERGQFYLHQFLDKQPDLNYRSSALRTEMENVIKFWLNHGIDGYRIDAVPFLVEDAQFRDEKYVDPKLPHNIYSNLIHTYTMDQNETFDVIRSWRVILDNYTQTHKVSQRIMLTEAYTELKTTMKYYGTEEKPISEIPFNFQLITQLSAQSNSTDFVKAIEDWFKYMPEGQWPNWVIGNHDNFRVAARYGTEIVDAINMLVTLLPGTAVTYYGEELGMENTFIRWDQTKDPSGIVAGKEGYLSCSRDGERTPMQWNSSVNAGFSTANLTWLPLNPNSWRLNVEEQKAANRSHYAVYKKLVEARQLETIQQGDFHIYAPTAWTLIFTRSLKNTTFVVVLNIGTEEVQPDLSVYGLPDNLSVYTSSINAEQEEGDILSTSADSFTLRPKAALVLTTDNVPTSIFDPIAKLLRH